MWVRFPPPAPSPYTSRNSPRTGTLTVFERGEMHRTGIARSCEMTADRLSCWPSESRMGFGHRRHIASAQPFAVFDPSLTDELDSFARPIPYHPPSTGAGIFLEHISIDPKTNGGCSVSVTFYEQPILNSPYSEPVYHTRSTTMASRWNSLQLSVVRSFGTVNGVD